MNVIPIDRQAQPKSLRRSLAMCEEFLQRTHGNLILYPEGTRSRDGEIQPFKKGAGLFAADLGVPVVPAHIAGTHNILAKGKFVPRPGAVFVRFGEPVMFESNQFDHQFDHRLGRELRKAAVELLEQRVRGLSRLPPTGDVIRLPEEPEKEERATISISAVGQGDGNTESPTRSRVSE